MALVCEKKSDSSHEDKSSDEAAVERFYQHVLREAITVGITVSINANCRVVRVRHRDFCWPKWPNCHEYLSICEWSWLFRGGRWKRIPVPNEAGAWRLTTETK